MKKHFGTPDQLKDMVEERIAELGGDVVESATNTVNVAGEPIFGEDADRSFDDYCDELKDRVATEVDKFMSDYTWNTRDGFITVSIPGDEKIHVVDIPTADLSKDMKHIDDDVEYIVRFLKDEFGIKAAKDVKSAYNWDAFMESEARYDDWEEVARKSVQDADGLWTDYVMYKKKGEDLWICMFGDSDIYPPDIDYADWSEDDETAAWEWFDSYEGFTDDEFLQDEWEG